MNKLLSTRITQQLVILLHFVEEIVGGFPHWATRHFGTTTSSWYLLSHLFLIPLVFLPLFVKKRHSAFIRIVLQTVMLSNALFHISSTIAFREYSPGLITGLLLVIPYSMYCYTNEIKGKEKDSLFPILLGGVLGVIIILSLYIEVKI